MILILVLLQSSDTAVKVALFGLVLGFYFIHQLHSLNKSNRMEMIVREGVGICVMVCRERLL